MNVIHINFADREYNNAYKLVVGKLEEWGLTDSKASIPEDAVACALDDVIYYSDLEKRNMILKRLEEALIHSKTPLMTTL